MYFRLPVSWESGGHSYTHVHWFSDSVLGVQDKERGLSAWTLSRQPNETWPNWSSSSARRSMSIRRQPVSSTTNTSRNSRWQPIKLTLRQSSVWFMKRVIKRQLTTRVEDRLSSPASFGSIDFVPETIASEALNKHVSTWLYIVDGKLKRSTSYSRPSQQKSHLRQIA